MTPLAERVARQLLKPVTKRNPDDALQIYKTMSGAHFFDLTQVTDQMWDVANRISDGSIEVGDLAFLPAPKTWIEYDEAKDNFRGRVAYLLVEDAAKAFATGYYIGECGTARNTGSPGGYWTDNIDGGGCQLASAACRDVGVTYRDPVIDEDGAPQEQAIVFAMLALINSPRVINRRQFMPDRGLETALSKARGGVGKFPLHAWTELTLSVGDQVDHSDRQPFEAHLTGGRALHFCRQHLRIRSGRLERVRAHWRGDASLGIKRTRYRLSDTARATR